WQKHDSLASGEAAHVDPRFVAVRNFVDIEVLVFLRCKVQINLRALEALHVFFKLSGINAMRKHETDHERGVHDLPEAELLQNLIGYSPHAGRGDVAVDGCIDPRP